MEWVEHPGHPESIDCLKRLPRSSYAGSGGFRPLEGGSSRERFQGGVLKDLVIGLLSRYEEVNLEWVDATHLRVSPVGYEKIVAYKEEQKRIAEKNREALEEFEEKYSPVTLVYPLDNITPVTAKALIDRELIAFGFREYRSIREIESPGFSTLERWTDREDAVAKKKQDSGWFRRLTIEECVADEKANAVIVTAVPETHERIKALLAEMDGMLAEKERKEPPRQFRLGVVLLQGLEEEKSEELAPTEPAHKPPQDRQDIVGEPKGLDTVIESISFESQDIREIVALLSQYGKTSINVAGSVPDIKVTFNILTPRTLREVLEDLAKTYDLWIDYQPGNTIVRRGNERMREEKGETSPSPVEEYGIAPEDLGMFGFTSAKELGKGMVSVAAEKGDEGSAFVSLTESYACEFEFLDFREPYLILKGRMVEQRGDKVLLENTLYLEPEKPALLGLTNLREALILLVRLHGNGGTP